MLHSINGPAVCCYQLISTIDAIGMCLADGSMPHARGTRIIVCASLPLHTIA
jgi:hypothetical protein